MRHAKPLGLAATLLLCAGSAEAQVRAPAPTTSQTGMRIDINRSINDVLNKVIGPNDLQINKNVTERLLIWEDDGGGPANPKPSDPAAVTQWLKDIVDRGVASPGEMTQMSEAEIQQYGQLRAQKIDDDNFVDPSHFDSVPIQTTYLILADPDNAAVRYRNTPSAVDSVLSASPREVESSMPGTLRESSASPSQDNNSSGGPTSYSSTGTDLTSVSDDQSLPIASADYANAGGGPSAGGGGSALGSFTVQSGTDASGGSSYVFMSAPYQVTSVPDSFDVVMNYGGSGESDQPEPALCGE